MTTTDTEPAPATAVLAADAVVFSRPDGDRQSKEDLEDLYVLVILRDWEPYAGCWALPGGGVNIGEATDAAAARELEEETDLAVSLDELTLSGAYADPDRDPRGRVVSLAYMCFLPGLPRPRPVAGDDAADAQWMLVGELLAGGRLAFDHDQILCDALEQL